MTARTRLAAGGAFLATVVVAMCVLAYRGIVSRAASSTLARAEVAVAAAGWLPDPVPDDPGFTVGDAPGFIREMNARLVGVAGRIERLRREAGQPDARPPADDHGTFVHIYAFFGRVCDGLLRLQLISDADEARRLRNRVVVDYLAALKGVQVAEDNVAENPASSPGSAGVEATPAPEGPSRVMDTTTLPPHSRAGSG